MYAPSYFSFFYVYMRLFFFFAISRNFSCKKNHFNFIKSEKENIREISVSKQSYGRKKKNSSLTSVPLKRLTKVNKRNTSVNFFFLLFFTGEKKKKMKDLTTMLHVQCTVKKKKKIYFVPFSFDVGAFDFLHQQKLWTGDAFLSHSSVNDYLMLLKKAFL